VALWWPKDLSNIILLSSLKLFECKGMEMTAGLNRQHGNESSELFAFVFAELFATVSHNLFNKY